MSLAYELRELEDLRATGSLSEEEFQQAKARILESGSRFTGGNIPGQIFGFRENQWCALMHLSQLLTFSLAGIIVPIVMWVLSKDDSDVARRSGACMMNWLLSSLVYAAISLLLCFVVVGFGLLIALGILQIVFPILAALKANDGGVWAYPLRIEFISED